MWLGAGPDIGDRMRYLPALLPFGKEDRAVGYIHIEQELAGHFIARFGGTYIRRLVFDLDLLEPGDGVRFRVGVNDLMMHRAHDDKIIEAVTVGFRLCTVVAWAVATLPFDMADFPYDRTRCAVNYW